MTHSPTAQTTLAQLWTIVERYGYHLALCALDGKLHVYAIKDQTAIWLGAKDLLLRYPLAGLQQHCATLLS
jgi:hypothetical protein